MRYITVDEFKIIGKILDAIKAGTFDAEYRDQAELWLGDTLDVIVVDGVRTLKYSNILLIGIEKVEE